MRGVGTVTKRYQSSLNHPRFRSIVIRTVVARASTNEAPQHFVVHKTGRNPYHVTIELPRPVTDEVAAQFNRLFGRSPR